MNGSDDVSALRARVDVLERKVEFLLRHLQLTCDDHTQDRVEAAVAEALRRGDRVRAITVYREPTGADLKASKEAVEAIATTLGMA